MGGRSLPGTYKIPGGIRFAASIILISIKTIVLIMPTTITIKEKTKERLSDYKFGDWTFDDVLNMLMDKISIEDISAEHIKEHYRRLADFKAISKEEFKSRIKKRALSGC
ncbi:MAG: hypothetical protein OIN66_03190 [Candidatus Methanoperedens sp.]|nr:hypothetical protein [Candidatus Methanoperedens sp.]